MKRLILIVGLLMLAGTAPASGNDTDPLMLGDANIAQHTTRIDTTLQGYGYGGSLLVTNGGTANAVLGASSGGTGVQGYTDDGIAVKAEVSTASVPNDATALDVVGIAKFSRSGTVTMTGCKITLGMGTGVTYPGSVLNSTRVLATAQSYQAGVFVAGVVTHPEVDTFTIYLSKVPTKPVAVFWMLVG